MQLSNIFGRRAVNPISRKEEYTKEYLASKVHGKSFFPDIIFKDSVAALLVCIVILTLAIFAGAPLEDQADPTNTTYAPRPEWYFLFLFEGLKHFPGSLEWIAALGLPAAGIGFLFLLPLIDRSRKRHPLDRPIALGICVAVLGGIGYLTYAGVVAPTVSGAATGDDSAKLMPYERAGKQIFQERRCPVCHTIAGVGGKIGPDLTTVGRRLDVTALINHLKQPPTSANGVSMPDFNLTDTEMLQLASYLLTLKNAPPPMTLTQAGKATFNVYCNICHPGANAGTGPKISGSDFTKRYPLDVNIMHQVRSPKAGGMPAFSQEQLSDEQLAAIIAYLRTMK